MRIALTALIIKEDLGLSDRDCVEQITQNPYLQFFCGLKAFITEPPFDASMYVHFGKRFAANVVQHVNDAVADKIREAQPPPDDPENPQPPSPDDKKGKGIAAPPTNQGKLLVDATCTPADITYPTDLKLLNT